MIFSGPTGLVLSVKKDSDPCCNESYADEERIDSAPHKCVLWSVCGFPLTLDEGY